MSEHEQLQFSRQLSNTAIPMKSPINFIPDRKYQRGKLLKLVYDYATSDLGRDNILRYFLTSMTARPEQNPTTQDFSHVLATLDDFEDRSASEKNEVVEKAKALADHLVDYFFLPRGLLSANKLLSVC